MVVASYAPGALAEGGGKREPREPFGGRTRKRRHSHSASWIKVHPSVPSSLSGLKEEGCATKAWGLDVRWPPLRGVVQTRFKILTPSAVKPEGAVHRRASDPMRCAQAQAPIPVLVDLAHRAVATESEHLDRSALGRRSVPRVARSTIKLRVRVCRGW